MSFCKLRSALGVLILSLVGFSAGCGISLTPDPATSVEIEISGISDKDDRDEVGELLGDMADGSSHSMMSSYSGDKFTVTLSPVSDVEAFSKDIEFGNVTSTSVDDRTIAVDFTSVP